MAYNDPAVRRLPRRRRRGESPMRTRPWLFAPSLAAGVLPRPRAGAAAALYGEWHLGHHPPFLPTRHGFADYYGLPYSNEMWPRPPTAKFPALPLLDGMKTVALNPDQSRLTTDYTERAVQFIAKN